MWYNTGSANDDESPALPYPVSLCWRPTVYLDITPCVVGLPSLKVCSRCNIPKPRTAFSRGATMRDGLYSYCKACSADNSRVWAAANRKRRAESSQKWRANHHQLYIESLKEWRSANPDKVRISRNKRRFRIQSAEGTYSAGDLAAIRAAQTDKCGRLICWRCGKPIKGTPHLDHWIPLAKGGANEAGNLHYMHGRCNQSKGAKHPTEIGRLL